MAIQNKITQVFAHRGASQYAPENTIEAFALAIEQGADGIELDVQLTKDGQVVVIHDETIDRVSNGKGTVREYTLDELRQYSFHYKFPQFGKVAIPTLKEVLNIVKTEKTVVNIELKTGIYWYPGIEQKVNGIVKGAGMQKRVIYSSFNHYSVQKIKELDPEAVTAYLYSDVILNIEQYAKDSGVCGLHPAVYHLKMADFLERYLDSGLAVRVWTVNSRSDMRMFIKTGVDAIITNKPDIALRIREEQLTYAGNCFNSEQ